MRASMFVIGIVVIAWGVFLWRVLGYPIWFSWAIGIFNFILGVITPKSRKVDLEPDALGAVKLVVDRVRSRTGRLRFSDYELVFSDNELVMKKLPSLGLGFLATVVTFALGGFFGGLTGVSVMEFLNQRKRDKIRDANEFTTIASGDREIPYQSMSQVQLDGESLKMSVGGRPLVLSLAPEYTHLIAPRVRELIPDECWVHPRSYYG